MLELAMCVAVTLANQPVQLSSFGRAGQLRKLESAGSLTIPYAVPIAAGTLIWWFGRGIQL